MKTNINIHDLAKLFSSKMKSVNTTVNDVTRISLSAYRNFYEKCVQSQPLVKKLIGEQPEHDYFASAIYQGMKEAFDLYDARRGTKFTTYLYATVTHSLLDERRELLKKDEINSYKFTPRQSVDITEIAENEVFTKIPDVFEEICRKDALDELSQYLFCKNEIELFMLLPLHILGYSGREMAKFMMRDEKTIRKWKEKLMAYAAKIYHHELPQIDLTTEHTDSHGLGVVLPCRVVEL